MAEPINVTIPETLTKHYDLEEITIETDDPFISLLSQIHPEKKLESSNWIIKEQISEHIFKVSNQQITLTIDRKVHLPINEQAKDLNIGDSTTILFSCHYPNISYGFYAFKSDLGELDALNGIGRLYFNLRFEYAIDFTKELLTLLYENKLKFDYKVFKNLRTQYRIDSAVLYFSLNEYNKILNFILPYLLSNQHLFNDEVSVFHYPISKGVGFAEEPHIKADHESYGLNRCRIIAEAINDSLDTIENKGVIPLERIEKRFVEKNINPYKMYLNPNSILDEVLNV